MLGKLKRCVITQRDVDLFQYLFRHKLALKAQIIRDIFQNKSHTTVTLRLNKLCNYGWTKSYPIQYGNYYRKVYHLSQIAYQTYVQSNWFDYAGVKLKSDSPHHDLLLNNIKHQLLSLKTVEKIVSENELYQKPLDHLKDAYTDFRLLQSDAAVHLSFETGNKYIVPLELEASIKSNRRCYQKMRDYLTKTDFPAILYVITKPSIQEQMVRHEKRLIHNQDPRFFFASLDQVIDQENAITFTNQQGGTLRLD